MAKADPPKKEKNIVGQAGLIGGGSYLNKLGNIAKGPYTGSFYTGFKTPGRPLYFKPGKGVVKGSQAFNNFVWLAESAADAAVKNRININADISPGYDWKKTTKVGNIRTAGKALRVLGKASTGIGTAWMAYDAAKWVKDNPGEIAARKEAAVKNVKNVYYHADKYVGGLLPGGAPNFMGKLVKKAWKEQGDFWDEQDRKHLEFNKDVIERVRSQQNGS